MTGKAIHLCITILLCVIPHCLWAQDFNVCGVIFDDKSRESLVGVTISVIEKPTLHTTTDSKGKYCLTLPKGEYHLSINYLGFEKKTVQILVSSDFKQDINLTESSIQLREVTITSRPKDANVASSQSGVIQMEVSQINKLPVLMGERDVIKSLELTPGVKSAGEGSSGLFVRGGTADQNLIMLDNVSIYNASHLMGFFSTFNSDVLQDVSLYKGPIPAQYGERLSGILDIQQRNGNTQDIGISGGIGLISSKLNIEGPIQKGKSSFLIGARRTYADAIARLAGISEARDAYLYFYDLNMKLFFTLSDRDQLSISGYSGKDMMKIKKIGNTDWGNSFLNIKWTRDIRCKWLSLSSLMYNQYTYGYKIDMEMYLDGYGKIKDYGFKQEFVTQGKPENIWRIGAHSTYHDIGPGDFTYRSDSENKVNLHHRYSWENGIFATNQRKVTERMEILFGLRFSSFSALGKGEYYTLDENREIIDSTWYGSGDFIKTYFNFEPRLSVAYKVSPTSSIKSSYSRTTQNMHLLMHISQGTPFDRWTSSSNNIKPQTSDLFTVGYFRNFDDNTYEMSIETYYKKLRNQLDLKDHAEFKDYDAIDSEVLPGKGRAYGIEFLFKKRTGKFNGWIGYTLSKSEKKIEGINNNKWYNSIQDRTHDITLVGIYELNPKWTLSATWVYYTGNAITYPSGKYQIDGKDVMYYAERNGYRAPAYHRLDFGATCLLKKTVKYESELSFGLYNAYGRRNAYMIEFRTNDDDPSKTSAYRYALFTFVPSITWSFKF